MPDGRRFEMDLREAVNHSNFERQGYLESVPKTRVLRAAHVARFCIAGISH
jgi:hypothetical protein